MASIWPLYQLCPDPGQERCPGTARYFTSIRRVPDLGTARGQALSAMLLSGRDSWTSPPPTNSDECRRMARHYLAMARQMSVPDHRALMMTFAAYWTEQAEKAEREARQQQVQPKKDGEGN